MYHRIYESEVEEFAVELLIKQGWQYLSTEEKENARQNLQEVILLDRLKSAIDRINAHKNIPTIMYDQVKDSVIRQVLTLNLPDQNLFNNNKLFHQMLIYGVNVEYNTTNYGVKGDQIHLIDFENITNNDFVVCNQFSVTANTISGTITKKPDLVLFINGIPVCVLELKNPADINATVDKAFIQLQNYKTAIPKLFYYNAILVASDGYIAKAGTITSAMNRFSEWKSQNGELDDSNLTPRIETLINGMLNKKTILDLIANFIVFEQSNKKIAAYHQYFAVNKAVESTIVATKAHGDRKAGVVWHTQGSGKSLSMVFYTGKIMKNLELKNPTVVVITDRLDLDQQLFDTFSDCKQTLGEVPQKANSRAELKRLLQVIGGGIIFTTIQKFFPEDGISQFDLLSDRKNIVIIADEAHRSQYGFISGFAKHIREALPSASFIGFTGTPIEKNDASTTAVFGNYIDIYDIKQSVEDGATVSIYYEPRLVKVNVRPDEWVELDNVLDQITEQDEVKISSNKKFAQIQTIVGNPSRLKIIANDIVTHFEQREEAMSKNGLSGKAMIVCMSRSIAVNLYDEIVKCRSDWHSPDLAKGSIKVVITSQSSDPESWQQHSTTAQQRKILGERFKQEKDQLKLVIVCDMWLTGFDVPCLHTMYIDKPMRGHNLMQAIARVNRVFQNKQGGLIVDYIGIGTDLKTAIATYTDSGGRGNPILNQDIAINEMLKQFEIVTQMLSASNIDYSAYSKHNVKQKMSTILAMQEYIFADKSIDNSAEKLQARFFEHVKKLLSYFTMSVPHQKALEITTEVSFFRDLRNCILKFARDLNNTQNSSSSNIDNELAAKQAIDDAIVADNIIDVFDAAGLKKPDVSILSEDFLQEVRSMEHKNTAIALLKKILNNEISIRSKQNLTQSKTLSEMLERAIKRYHNNLLTTAEIIEELISIAKQISAFNARGSDLGLNNDELAFYDALASHSSIKDVFDDRKLCLISREVLESVRQNATIDWILKESAQARLRLAVKKILRKYGYPTYMEEDATKNIMQQAELLS